MEPPIRIRNRLARTATMFVAVSLARCGPVQSWLLRPPVNHIALGALARTRCPIPTRSMSRMVTSSSSSSSSSDTEHETTLLSEDDRRFLQTALENAKNGKGHTFPNPAVGCVIVRQDTNEILGSGFHPRSGYPHAEVFALLEAAGHIDSGVSAAKSVLSGTSGESDLAALMDEYTSFSKDDDDGSSSGPERLFGNALSDLPVTAYVTLEPCCHYGKTPPCAASLSLAGVDKVVVGVRDPNPRVDGGGFKVLQEAGISVVEADDSSCSSLVDSFVKRISPKNYDAESYSHVTGAMRRGLRKLASQKKASQELAQVSWNARGSKITTEEQVESLDLPPGWMEHLDDLLWREELVNIRLNKAVSKKKLAKVLGQRVAAELGAHVAQVLGHTVLLYRPAMPNPVLDLEDLRGDGSAEENDE